MSNPTAEASVLTSEVLLVEPWLDPVIDQMGHDPRSRYVEHFWLPVLGPSTTWLLRRIADGLEHQPDGFELDLADTARSLGLSHRGGRHSPFSRSLDRFCQFGLGQRSRDVLRARRRVPPLPRAQQRRLPDRLQRLHQQLEEQPVRSSAADDTVIRARALARSLFELGEEIEAIERQLHLWKFHPAIASDAVRRLRPRAVPTAPSDNAA